METIVIDIDTLLEVTFDLTAEKCINKLKPVEIDYLLDTTKDW